MPRTIPIVQDSRSRAPPKVFAAKQLQGKICLSPYVSVEIGIEGEVRLCGCAAWMPTTVGNILEQSLTEILSSALSQEIRASIRDGTYQFCDEQRCGIMANDLLNSRDRLPPAVAKIIDDPSQFLWPREIILAGDMVCNLSCPSCRTEVIKKNQRAYSRDVEVAKIIANNLFGKPTDQEMRLFLSTSGELFASRTLMTLVSNLDPEQLPNLRLKIQTNGVLMPARWYQLGRMQDRVESITVTIDAARPKTYETLRRGARWHQIVDAMTWLSQKKQTSGIRVHARMIVQQLNYREIEEFYHWSRSHGADIVEYSRILDWGTFGRGFLDHDVFDPQHPEYQDAINELAKVRHFDNVYRFGGL